MIRHSVIGLVACVLVVMAILFALGLHPDHIVRMFEHPVTGGIRVGADVAVAPAAPPEPAGPRTGFGTANYAVLGIYLGAMLGIGLLVGRKVKGTRDFFIAGGKLNYFIVGLSILGTYLSALTMMGVPGMAFGKHDWTFMVQLPFLILTAVLITGFVLPRYRKAGLVSIYAFLEQKIGVVPRMIAAVSFIIFSIGRMGLVLYLPALAFSTVTGVSLPACLVVMAIIITVYTVVGGMEAVVWTDAIQVIIFILGAGLTLGYVFSSIGADRFVDVGLQHNKFRILSPGLHLGKITSLWLILETLFQTVRIYGTQQDIAQRYMTTPSTEKAARSIWIGILGYIPIGFVFYFLGTALFVFYQLHPDPGLPVKADRIYPYFVVHQLPAGIAGLVIAAIFAAAMSSIDSCMNSASTVCIEDFFKRFSRSARSDAQYLVRARILTVVWGVLALLMGFLFMNTEYAQVAWGKLMGISTNGVLGLMALAFLPFRVNQWGAVAGMVVAYAYLFVMMGLGVNYLLWPVVGNLACFLTAILVHLLLRWRKEDHG